MKSKPTSFQNLLMFSTKSSWSRWAAHQRTSSWNWALPRFVLRALVEFRLSKLITNRWRLNWKHTVAVGVIEVVTDPSEWCHPIRVVPPHLHCKQEGILWETNHGEFAKAEQPRLLPITPRLHSSSDNDIHWQGTLLYKAQPSWLLADSVGRGNQALDNLHHLIGSLSLLPEPARLISVEDEYNLRTDAAFNCLPTFIKIVDDELLFDNNFDVHVGYIWDTLLHACTLYWA